MVENIYALYHGAEDEPVLFYIGKTSGTVDARFADHLRGIKDHSNGKEAYEYARHIGVEHIKVFPLGTTEHATEADFVRAAILDGHRIFNSNAGNSVVAKKRTTSEFARSNRQADERIERKTLLHGKAQQLSKSEIVATRILDVLPDEQDLLQAEWRDTPGEMIPTRPQKFAKYIRWGDYKVVLGGPKLDHFKIGYVHDTKRNRTCACSVDRPLPLERFAPLLARTLEKAVWSDRV